MKGSDFYQRQRRAAAELEMAHLVCSARKTGRRLQGSQLCPGRCGGFQGLNYAREDVGGFSALSSTVISVPRISEAKRFSINTN